jgi:hypothetical protein
MSDAALVDVVRNMSSSSRGDAERVIGDALQHDICMKESIEDARMTCARCGADEELLVRRPDLSQTLICSVCGCDTKMGMDFDCGRTYAYDDEDEDTAPHQQSAVTAFGDADTGAIIDVVTGKRRRCADAVRASASRASDRSDMVAALSQIIKAHAHNALLPCGAESATLIEVPFEPNPRIRTRVYAEARRRILNAAHILRAVTNGIAPRSIVVPRFRSIFQSGVQFLTTAVGDWVGSREACLDAWRYVICDWYRRSGIQQRNYHVFMVVAIVYAGLRTGCAIPPERCVLEMSQCTAALATTGLSAVGAIVFETTLRRFYDRWGRILTDAADGTTATTTTTAIFPPEQPSSYRELQTMNFAVELPPDSCFAWSRIVLSLIRWFVASCFVFEHARHAPQVLATAERQVTYIWERRHMFNSVKCSAHTAFVRGNAKLHSFWRFLREPERLAHFETIYAHAYCAPWFTDVPVFRDSGAWACAILCLQLLDSPHRPDGLDVCDYFGRRTRDVMPFVAAIEAISLLQ